MATWILTASPENHEATAAHGFEVIGLKERRHRQALEIETGDRIVLYLTRVMRFAASIRVTGDLYEDREKIWPGKPGKADPYPWRFPTEPELVLDEAGVAGGRERPKDELEHIRKWPAEHWKLAFQGQLRTVSEHDAALLLERMRAGRAHPSRHERGRPAAPDRAAPRALGSDQQLAGLAALALLLSMFLPWYEKSVVDPRGSRFVSDTVSAFGTVSFVEAAVFLVSAGVLVLLFTRAEGSEFELPGGDGTVILAGGAVGDAAHLLAGLRPARRRRATRAPSASSGASSSRSSPRAPSRAPAGGCASTSAQRAGRPAASGRAGRTGRDPTRRRRPREPRGAADEETTPRHAPGAAPDRLF